jgi:exodeoxyribonuclease-5
MRRAGMASASTIHGLIYFPVKRDDGSVDLFLRSMAEMPWRGFLVDEASMVGRTLYEDLLSFDRPVVFVGDHGQLPPVADDGLRLMQEPMYRLERIHRNAGAIAHFAQHLREGKPAGAFVGGDAVTVVGRSKLADDMLLYNGRAGQIICGFNNTRVRINQTLRQMLDRQGPLADGDRVMCLRNDRRAGLFNGLQGTAHRVNLQCCTMDFEADGVIHEEIAFDPSVLGKEKPSFDSGPNTPHPFDYCYCVTCHKAQGDEWPSVLVLEEHAPKFWDPRLWNYTAASRARRQLVWVTVEPSEPLRTGGAKVKKKDDRSACQAPNPRQRPGAKASQGPQG